LEKIIPILDFGDFRVSCENYFLLLFFKKLFNVLRWLKTQKNIEELDKIQNGGISKIADFCNPLFEK
jgi:hypothetical protein